MPSVEFRPDGRVLEAAPDSVILEICEDHDLPMEAACGGFAACNTCRVRVLAGELSPKDDVEVPFLDRPDQRLGCQARLTDSNVVLLLDPGDA